MRLSHDFTLFSLAVLTVQRALKHFILIQTTTDSSLFFTISSNCYRKTLLLAVGYLDSPNFPIGTMLANEYEALGYNVILVDNQRFATVHYYL